MMELRIVNGMIEITDDRGHTTTIVIEGAEIGCANLSKCRKVVGVDWRGGPIPSDWHTEIRLVTKPSRTIEG